MKIASRPLLPVHLPLEAFFLFITLFTAQPLRNEITLRFSGSAVFGMISLESRSTYLC